MAICAGALVAKLASKRPSPLARGDLRVWAAAVIYTLANKSRMIRDQLSLAPYDVEFLAPAASAVS